MEIFEIYNSGTRTSQKITFAFMKNILMLIVLIYNSNSIAQSFHRMPELFNDNSTINYVVDSLKHKNQINSYLLFQVRLPSSQVVSYLICNYNLSDVLWIISSDSILEKREIKANQIFTYPNIKNTGALIQEDSAKFKTPVLSPLDNDVIVYHNYRPNVKLYFEYGGVRPSTYQPFQQREIYRKEWHIIIKQTLAPYFKH